MANGVLRRQEWEPTPDASSSAWRPFCCGPAAAATLRLAGFLLALTTAGGLLSCPGPDGVSPDGDNGGGDESPSLVAPSDLSAVAVSANRIDLTWTDNCDCEDGFRIEGKRGVDGLYGEVAVYPWPDGTSASVVGLAPSATYYFRACAYNTQGNSGYSNEDSAKTLPGSLEHTVSSWFYRGSCACAVDLDGDGDADVVAGAQDGEHPPGYRDDVAWFENDGNEVFTEHTIAVSCAGVSSVHSIDLDGDGDLDVVAAAYDADLIGWFENDGSENFVGHTIAAGFDSACSAHAADMDGDGDLDVLGAASGISKTITWWENDGSENFTAHTVTTEFISLSSVCTADVDSDGDLDVLAAGGCRLKWWENDGSGSFSEHTITASLEFATSVDAGDVDSDGDVDVLVAAGQYVMWWRNNGDGSYTQVNLMTVASATGARSVHAVDMDGDGDLDVLGAAESNPDHATIAWWENNGSDDPTQHTIATDFWHVGKVHAAEIDGDGDIDVVAANGARIAWWEMGY